MSNTYVEPEEGQVWLDLDNRRMSETIEIDFVGLSTVFGVRKTGYTKIRLDRMKPYGATRGYVLLKK